MINLFSEPKPMFSIGKNKKYKVEAIKDSVISTKKIKRYLLGLYNLVF